jgi:HAD superfamily hydrolase (TIGR01509 family)
MITLIVFDLDGVLVEAKDIHFKTFNRAVEEIAGIEYTISEAEHYSIYDGLKTNTKLELLTSNKGLPTSTYYDIWNKKQSYTLEALKKLKRSETLKSCINTLVYEGYKLAVCSNSIRKTVLTALSKLDIIECFDLILSNEDVKNSKPHPEMYWKAMSILGKLPEETLVIEDSPYGLLAASRSRAKIMRVDSPKEVIYDNILKHVKEEKMNSIPKWKNDKLNVLIPMAGLGSRFQDAGYTFPKPIIDVKGKPMIQAVIDNLNLDANFIYVVQKEHIAKYNLDMLLNLITPKCKIIEVEGITEGAACTTLLARDYLDNNNPLIIANCDQLIEWNSNEFMYKMIEQKVDAGIVTFTATHPKWSFVKVDEYDYITEVAEKNPISDIATVGIYYWSNGSDYIKYADQMISKNIRVNGEFYVCPIFNEAINDNKKIKRFNVEKMWGIGTPEDLNYFIKTT